jgi:ATP-dependent exoDNAse (exonuclease V) beta subunit
VAFVNDACRRAMKAVGEKVDEEGLGSRIDYADLVAGVGESDTAQLEWLVAEKRTEKKNGEVTIGEDLEAEAAQAATRIAELVGHADIIDAEDGKRRPIANRDIAILYRSRKVLPAFEAALSRAGIRYYISGAPHLGDRQEILDLLNLLRLLRNPRDDYRAFGFLRSPFVALRDEVIVGIAQAGRGRSLLQKARWFLGEGEWFDGPEGPGLSAAERAALERALEVVVSARALVHRVPLDDVLQFVLDRLGYRLHLLVGAASAGGSAEEQLANIQSFLQFTEQYRDLDIATFLEVWERWDAQDNGLPQAPLYSKDDDVVTLSTIHAAKGLEWPVVFLVGTGGARSDRNTHSFWSDPELGPVLCPAQDDRGRRTWSLWRRDDAEELAEDTRLLYVATTRARDRLVIVGPRERDKSYSAILAPSVGANSASAPFMIRDEAPETAVAAPALHPTLAWLGDLVLEGPPPLLQPVADPLPRFVVSATELMGRAKDEKTWRLRYRHGVQPKWEFARQMEEGTLDPAGAAPSSATSAAAATSPAGKAAPPRPIPATVRGTVIHGVLEHIREEAELSRLLHETIGGLDDPDLEEALEAADYRAALEEEIRRVVRSEEWAWYVEGEHYRELEFVHLAGEREWRVGAFDLYRPGPPAWVIDFKTHEIEAHEAAKVARDYTIQARIYREASAIGDGATIALHFTGPNSFVEME